MIISRILAFISFSMVVIILGAEGLRILQQQESGWITVQQMNDFVTGDHWNKLANEVVDETAISNWQIIIDSIADFPALFLFLIVTVLFSFIGRKRFRK